MEAPPVPIEDEIAVPGSKVLLTAVTGDSGEEEGVKVVVTMTVPVTNEEMVVTLALDENGDEAAGDVTLEDDSGLGKVR
jgi:hypothetical protein